MKKIVLLVLVFLIFTVSLYSDAIKTNPGTFEIKGYKLNRNAGVTITLVDALTGSLKEISADENLNINGYFTPGQASSTKEDNVDDIAFAYRVSGNSTGSYTVGITVTPFIQKIKDENDKEIDGDVIKTAYFLVNETVRFLDSNKETTIDYEENLKGLKIDGNDSGNKSSGILLNSSQSSTLSDSFEISGDSNDTNDFWIARGAIGFVVDSDSYEKAPEGEYKALITVKLEDNT